MTFTYETNNDAGLLREYLNTRYGQFAAFGGSLDTAERVHRLARRLAKLADITMDDVFADMRAAYEAT